MAGGGVYSDRSEPHHLGHLGYQGHQVHQDQQGHQSYPGYQDHQSYPGLQDHQDHQSYPGPSAAAAEDHKPAAPAGELVHVFCEANPNYRLTVRGDAAVLAFKNSRDLSQQWIKVDVGAGHGGFIDREGQPGFILVNKATGLPLKHGIKANEFVTLYKDVFEANSPMDGSIIWSLGRKDEGHGFKGLRAVTNIHLNLEAANADKAHGGVRDGNRLLVSTWLGQENFKWKVQTFEPVA